ncbi:hypothetical protein [Streptomyces carpinensis]|uniref:Uncharacterized protein n=1 Tax=Streptomyces carpinensis TaxID=66369 RepID=A0ABV1WAM2_9ACTN|nr:hypothetical protein [Streptomyces carpinensis]
MTVILPATTDNATGADARQVNVDGIDRDPAPRSGATGKAMIGAGWAGTGETDRAAEGRPQGVRIAVG